MGGRISTWLKKEIRPLRRCTPPSPFARTVGRVLQILMLLVLCSFILWRLLLYREVHSQFVRIRLAGLPASGDELNSWRRPAPDAENGALVLTQAFALIHTFPDRRSNEVAEPKLLTRTNVWASPTRELIEAYTKTNQPALAKACEGLLLPLFRYPVDFSCGPETELPHLRSLKEMARIAALLAALEAGEGKAELWPANVEFQLNLARTLDDEPALISHLVRAAIIRTAVKATERSLNQAAPNNELCKRLQGSFSRMGETNLLPLALIGERAMAVPTFRLSRKEIQSFSQTDDERPQPHKPQRYSGKPATFLWLTSFFERDLDFFLQTMKKSISLAALPAPSSLRLTNYLESASDIATRRVYILSGLLLSSLSRVIVREASTRALAELASTALAVERFRHERGKLPSDLKELTPQFLDSIPLDPFDGAPLRYRRLDRGYVVYSLDADERDDGGREPPERRKPADKTSYDITFIVEH